MTRATAIFILGTLLGGCTTLSGLTTPNYACKAPDGVSCQSVSGNYANALAHNLPSQRLPSQRISAARPVSMMATVADTTSATAATALSEERVWIDPPSVGAPIRTPPKVMRVWLAPAEDSNGVFHDQRFIYLTVSPGSWQIDSALSRLRNSNSNGNSRLMDSRQQNGSSPSLEGIGHDLPPSSPLPAQAARKVAPIRVQPVDDPPAKDIATAVTGNTAPATKPRVIIRPLLAPPSTTPTGRQP